MAGNKTPSNRRGRAMAMGVLLGMAIGSAIGIFSENMAVWMVVGAGAGLALGAVFGRR